MEPLQIALLLLAGAVTGFLAGFFRIGGGVILVPILLAFFQGTGVSSLVGTHLAFGTSLLVIAFTASGVAYRHAIHHQVIWKTVLVLGIAAILGALGGSWLAGLLAGKTLQKFFAVLAFLSAIRLLAGLKKPGGDGEPKQGAPGLLATGLTGGIVSSLGGVGGSIVMTPVLYSILRFPLQKAIGTSSAGVVIGALATVIGYVLQGWKSPLLPSGTFGFVDPLAAIPLILGSVPATLLGARMEGAAKSDALRKLFAVFLVIIAMKMFFF